MKSIYILKSVQHPWLYKIGISKNTKKRKRTVGATLTKSTKLVFSCPLFFARFWERVIHSIYFPLRTTYMGSGKTEWFSFVYPLSPKIVILVFWLVEKILLVFLLISIVYGINLMG